MDEPRGIVWDLDGTLIDSGDDHWATWHAALQAEGVALSRAQFDAGFGQRNDRFLRGLLGEDLSDADVARISAAKEAAYRDMVRAEGVQLLPGAQAWLARLHAQGWRQALGSSAPRQNVDVIVEVLQLDRYLMATVSGDDVQRGKPDPQVFLLAATRIGVRPARCIVVEDAPVGIAAGRNGGMRTIAVRTTHADLTGDLVVDTLDQLAAVAFDQLVPIR